MLGALLAKYLPHDIYTVYKAGARMRIDGALKGVKADAASMLPQWCVTGLARDEACGSVCDGQPLAGSTAAFRLWWTPPTCGRACSSWTT